MSLVRLWIKGIQEKVSHILGGHESETWPAAAFLRCAPWASFKLGTIFFFCSFSSSVVSAFNH